MALEFELFELDPYNASYTFFKRCSKVNIRKHLQHFLTNSVVLVMKGK